MKNKKTTWILLPGVLLIWGFLGWKLYAAMNDDESLPTAAIAEAPADEKSNAIPDTYQLLLDYPDPFLSAPKPVRKNPAVSNAQNPKPVVQKPEPPAAITWPDIRYSGLVKSPKDGKMVGFLSINGHSQFVKNGDVVEGLSIKSLSRDSVNIFMGKEMRTFRK